VTRVAAVSGACGDWIASEIVKRGPDAGLAKRANASLIRRNVRRSLKPFGQRKARRSASEHTGGATIQPKLTHAGGEHLDREHLDREHLDREHLDREHLDIVSVHQFLIESSLEKSLVQHVR
jgi:hypothetical protein